LGNNLVEACQLIAFLSQSKLIVFRVVGPHGRETPTSPFEESREVAVRLIS
jgi:hypothetical protein